MAEICTAYTAYSWFKSTARYLLKQKLARLQQLHPIAIGVFYH